MTTNKQHNQSLPEWFVKELEHTPVPDKDVLSQYDYLKEDFFQALDRAAEKLQKTGRPSSVKESVDAVFSLAGRLKARSEEVLREWLAPPGAFEPAPAGVRSLDSPMTRKPGQQGVCLERVSKVCGQARIQAALYQEEQAIEIEINLINDEDELEIRPFSVTVADDQGGLIQETLHIGLTQIAPCFPDPSPGRYVFSLTWESGQGELRLEFGAIS